MKKKKENFFNLSYADIDKGIINEATFKALRDYLSCYEKDFDMDKAFAVSTLSKTMYALALTNNTTFASHVENLKKLKKELVYESLLQISNQPQVTITKIIDGSDNIISQHVCTKPPDGKMYKEIHTGTNVELNNTKETPNIFVNFDV